MHQLGKMANVIGGIEMEILLLIISSCLVFMIFIWGKKVTTTQTASVIVMERYIRAMWKETGADTPEKQDDIAVRMILHVFSTIENREQYLLALSALRGMSNDIIKNVTVRQKLKYDFLVYGDKKGWLKENDLS